MRDYRLVIFFASGQNITSSKYFFDNKKNYIWVTEILLSDIFPTKILNYNLRSQTDFLRNNVTTTEIGLNSLRHCESKVWSLIPIEIKNSSSVEVFKSKVSGSLTTVSANFFKIICIKLNMFVNLVDVESVLILVIPDSRDAFTYKLEGYC